MEEGATFFFRLFHAPSVTLHVVAACIGNACMHLDLPLTLTDLVRIRKRREPEHPCQAETGELGLLVLPTCKSYAIKHETSHLPSYDVSRCTVLPPPPLAVPAAAVPAPRADAHAITHLLPLYLVVQY